VVPFLIIHCGVSVLGSFCKWCCY